MNAACSERVRELHTWFSGRNEGRNHLKIQVPMGGIIKMGLKEIGQDGEDWIHVGNSEGLF